MEGFPNKKTFFYRYKILVFNLLLMVVIAGVDPTFLNLIPASENINYYVGVLVIALLMFEFAGVWYKARFVYSIPTSLYQKVPWYIAATFVPRVVVSGVVAALALSHMGALEFSEFFLIPIVLYAAAKEFWVRKVLLDTEREPTERPAIWRLAISEIMLFIFVLACYFTVWKAYLLEKPRIMYMVLSPINWGFVAAGFLLTLYVLEMPYFWEDHLKPKTRLQKRLSFFTLLLPVVGLMIRFFLQGYYLDFEL